MHILWTFCAFLEEAWVYTCTPPPFGRRTFLQPAGVPIQVMWQLTVFGSIDDVPRPQRMHYKAHTTHPMWQLEGDTSHVPAGLEYPRGG